MEEEKNSYDEDQDYHEEFDETFEIGIPIDEALTAPPGTISPIIETDGGTKIETDIDPGIEPVLETEAADESPDQDFPDAPQPVPSPFDDIREQLQNLSQAFESKLKYDEHKNKIINDLHQSLQDYREGLVKKYLHRIITDIIKIVDDMRKFSFHYKNEPRTNETEEKLLKYIDNIASDLEDLFSWEGVLPFTCDGDMIDLSRQRILDRIATDDPEKDKTVAQRLRPGYEWDGKVIRPEMVSAYIYQSASTAEDNNN